MKRKDLKVLIVEEEPEIISLLVRVMQNIGLENIDIARNEEEANALIENKPDIVFLDTMYCVTDPYGPRIFDRMKAKGHKPKLTIASSAIPTNKSFWAGKGADYFLEKPFPHIRYLQGMIRERFPD